MKPSEDEKKKVIEYCENVFGQDWVWDDTIDSFRPDVTFGGWRKELKRKTACWSFHYEGIVRMGGFPNVIIDGIRGYINSIDGGSKIQELHRKVLKKILKSSIQHGIPLLSSKEKKKEYLLKLGDL